MLESADPGEARRPSSSTSRVLGLSVVASTLLLVGFAAVAGCAEGTDDGPGIQEADVTAKPDGSKLPANDAAGDDDDDDDDDVDAGPTDAGKSDAGKADAGPGDAGKADAGGPTAGGCAYPTTCEQSKILGEISGDTGKDKLKATGTTSAWVTVGVTENNTSLFSGSSLRVRATLTSPPGVDFDLYAYVSDGLDAKECSIVAESSRRTTATDTVNVEWGEANGGFPNGIRDDGNVTFEIRRVSGDCDATSTWTLNIEGNTP